MAGSRRSRGRWVLLGCALVAFWGALLLLPQSPESIAAAPSRRPLGVTACLNPAADAYISTLSPNGNFGTAQELYAGRVNNIDTSSLTRDLLRFDLSPTIPAGQLIISATLTLYVRDGETVPNTIGVHQVLTSWTESGVTWNNQPAHQPTAASSQTIGTPPGFVTWDVTQLVRDWYSGASPNNGLKLVSTSETVGTFDSKTFDSKEKAGGNLPCLSVEYTTPTATLTPTPSTTPKPGETFSPTPTPTQTGTPTITPTATPSPTATACQASLPTVLLISPTTGPAAQINKFLLRGSVSSPGGALLSATFTVADDTGTNSKMMDLLGSGLLPPNGGTFGPISVYDLLFPNSVAPSGNVLTLRAETCAGARIATARLAFVPIDPSTHIVLDRIEVIQATQMSDRSVPLVADKPAVARAYFHIDGSAQATSEIRQLTGGLSATRPDGSRPARPRRNHPQGRRTRPGGGGCESVGGGCAWNV